VIQFPSVVVYSFSEQGKAGVLVYSTGRSGVEVLMELQETGYDIVVMTP